MARERLYLVKFPVHGKMMRKVRMEIVLKTKAAQKGIILLGSHEMLAEMRQQSSPLLELKELNKALTENINEEDGSTCPKEENDISMKDTRPWPCCMQDVDKEDHVIFWKERANIWNYYVLDCPLCSKISEASSPTGLT
jgi:hypothetical protein